MALLIFPSTVPEAQAEARRQRDAGHRVIGAASFPPNHPLGTFDGWFRLPTIYDADFLAALRSVVTTEGIRAVIAPSAAVHATLARWAEDGRLPCMLSGSAPIKTAMTEWAARRDRAETAAAWMERVVGAPVDRTLVKAALSVPAFVHGESTEDKLVGLLTAALTAPPGDFVEIGVSMGRSAAVLALAARERGRALVTVDPWQHEHLVQRDVDGHLNDLMDEWSPPLVSDAFFAHRRLVTAGPLAHLRAPSTDAADQYRDGALLHTAGFSPVRAAGQVALLHIDGNHDLSSVEADWKAWSPHLAPGAWVVFDDYRWAHGEGPRHVADEAWRTGGEDGAFSIGDALFFQWTGAPATGKPARRTSSLAAAADRFRQRP